MKPAEILAAIRDGVDTFDCLRHRVCEAPAREKGYGGWRHLDRQLQALRRQGLILFNRKTRKWEVNS